MLFCMSPANSVSFEAPTKIIFALCLSIISSQSSAYLSYGHILAFADSAVPGATQMTKSLLWILLFFKNLSMKVLSFLEKFNLCSLLASCAIPKALIKSRNVCTACCLSLYLTLSLYNLALEPWEYPTTLFPAKKEIIADILRYSSMSTTKSYFFMFLKIKLRTENGFGFIKQTLSMLLFPKNTSLFLAVARMFISAFGKFFRRASSAGSTRTVSPIPQSWTARIFLYSIFLISAFLLLNKLRILHTKFPTCLSMNLIKNTILLV